ncbi:MAG: type II secretion system protein, partial [Aquificota bacterium]
MKKGFGLVEILVVMVILLIVGAGVFFAYRNIVGEAVVRSLVAKQEQDVNALVFQLKKDIASIGFGIDRSRLKQYGTNGIIECNRLNINDFADSNTLIARCEQDINREELYFLSLAGRQENLAGCWWFVDASGNLSTNSQNNNNEPAKIRNYRLQDCPPLPTGRCLILDIYKNQRYYGNCPTNFANFRNTLVFAHDSS